MIARRRNCGHAIIIPNMPRDSQGDIEIIEKVKNGETGEYEKLVRKYELPLERFVWRYIKNEHEIADVVQDTLVAAYKSLEGFDTTRKFSTWVFAIAKNKTMSYWRKKGKEVSMTDDVEYKELPWEEKIDARGRAVEVREKVAALPPKQRSVVELYYFSGMRYEEISRKLRTRINTVRSLLRRAKLMLKRKLWRHEKN